MISNCPKVSDLGIQDLCRYCHFHTIQFSHSNTITNKAMEAICLQSEEIIDVSLINCSKISNSVVEYLYEMIKPVGNRKTSPGRNIVKLTITDTLNITEDCFLFLSSAMHCLRELNMMDCENIDLSLVFKELKHIRSLSKLSIGPSKRPLQNPKRWYIELGELLPQLEEFHLQGMPNINDKYLAKIFDFCDNNLKVLSLIDLPVGTECIESICSTLAKLQKLSIIGSSIIGDKDLRCLSSVCLFLKSLTLINCPLL
jgi:hypothetical protein